MKLPSDVQLIPVQLKGNPLKSINCYLFRGENRNLLVDTGFNTSDCLADLKQGLDVLDVDMDKTDLFITHFHSDHCGLVSKIISPESRVYMSRVDRELFYKYNNSDTAYRDDIVESFLQAGVCREELMHMLQNNPAYALIDDGKFEILPVEDGDTLVVGQRRFICVFTPGHTPGHMCLYEPYTKTMVLGDHVLFDITPNITAWPTLPNALAHYLQNLEKIKEYDVVLALPAHRNNGGQSISQRAEELISHHVKRLNEVEQILKRFPESTAYEIAAHMSWSIRAKSWEEFPKIQKWFATGEALAHIEYLVSAGRVAMEEREGIRYYKNK